MVVGVPPLPCSSTTPKPGQDRAIAQAPLGAVSPNAATASETACASNDAHCAHGIAPRSSAPIIGSWRRQRDRRPADPIGRIHAADSLTYSATPISLVSRSGSSRKRLREAHHTPPGPCP